MSEGRILCLALSPALQRTLFMNAMRPGEVNRATRTLLSAAGKGVNAAAALARLGRRPCLLGLRGGPSGEFIAREIEALGVETYWIKTAAETRHCHTAVEANGARITEWVEESAPPSPAEWAALDRLFDLLLPGCAWLAISGALPPGAPDDRLADLALRARNAGVSLLVDSQGAPLRSALRARPDWVKLNAEELEKTTRMPVADVDERWEAMHALQAMGARTVLVTDGADDSYLLAGARRLRLSPPQVQALNPIGSGDSVTAGILHALADGATAEEAAALGLACGSANALTETPALFDVETVLALRARVGAVAG